MIRIVVALAALVWISTAAAQDTPRAEPTYIGTASMSADGTITLHLTRTSDGKFLNAEFTYKIDDPEYNNVLAHIGGLKPGETKPVRPWP